MKKQIDLFPSSTEGRENTSKLESCCHLEVKMENVVKTFSWFDFFFGWKENYDGGYRD